MSGARPVPVTVCSLLVLTLALLVTARLAHARRPTLDAASTAIRATILPVAAAQGRPPVARPSRWSGRRVRVDPSWAARTASHARIPLTAVTAYGEVTLRLQHESPHCRLGWTTLAGIGHVESEHGTLGGRRLLPDGRSSTPILGPALDGTTYAAIPSSPESAAWHGDTRWDHAIGPMQFISSTWRRWASDGDADGHRNPNDIFDASYATARYLCAAGADLTTAAGWTAAIRSYNHSDTYVATVLDAADHYAR